MLSTTLALVTSVQKAEAVVLVMTGLLVIYVMHSLNLFKRE